MGQVALQGRADAGDVDVIPHLKGGGLPLEMEGQHAPVHHVGAVALGGVVLGDVGKAPQHPLAAGGLLPGGAVAGLVGVEHRANFHRLGVHLLLAGNGADGLEHGLQLGVGLQHALPSLPGLLHGAYLFGAAHVRRVPAGQRELRQAQGVGAVGGSLPRGDELVGGGDFIQQLGADF